MSKNRFVFLILDTFKIYPGSLNNTVSRNTICRWFIRRHFQPKTCVGFSPSIPRQVHGKTIPEIAVLSGSIVWLLLCFRSIHQGWSAISSLSYESSRIFRSREVHAHRTPFIPRHDLFFSYSNFVICFRGCLKIVFTLLYALRLSWPRDLSSLNGFRRLLSDRWGRRNTRGEFIEKI